MHNTHDVEFNNGEFTQHKESPSFGAEGLPDPAAAPLFFSFLVFLLPFIFSSYRGSEAV